MALESAEVIKVVADKLKRRRCDWVGVGDRTSLQQGLKQAAEPSEPAWQGRLIWH